MEQLMFDVLKKNGLDKPNDSTPILIQSFNKLSLKRMLDYGIRHPMLLLCSAGIKLTPASFEDAKQYATAIGPSKEDVTPELVEQAHGNNLQVVAYTYNRKNLPLKFGSVGAEIQHALYELGIDGLFTDNPDQFKRRAN